MSRDAQAVATSQRVSAALSDARFEVMPTRGIEDAVRRVLLPGTTVHVMCPPAEGADHSVKIAAALAERGYDAVPHIAARTVRDVAHLAALVERMSAAGIRRGFFPGGDGKVPAGKFTSAVELLETLAEMPHELTDIGVAAYPEGHREIPKHTLLAALARKQEVATFMVSENCLDADQIVSWLRDTRTSGISLPLWVGLPGIVPVKRLVQALREFGLQAAVGYLRKQHGMVGAIMQRRFSPAQILDDLDPHLADPTLNIGGLHFFTFNELVATEAWRRRGADRAASRT